MILAEILKNISYENLIGNDQTEITKIVELDDELSNKNAIRWVNLKNIHEIPKFKTGTLICPVQFNPIDGNKDVNYIFSKNPRESFRELMILFEKNSESNFVNYKNSWVDENVTIHPCTKLGIGVVIEKDVEIGTNVKIEHYTVVKRGTILKNNISIGSNCTIGGFGHGYEKNSDGDYSYIPHLGNVIISDNVRIGNNSCIDRAVVGSTFIGENVKIHNLVQISHGVKIGRNCLVIANSMISGSTTIEENCWISPSATVTNKITVKKNSLLGIGTVVIKDIDENSIVAGNPSKFLRNNV